MKILDWFCPSVESREYKIDHLYNIVTDGNANAVRAWANESGMDDFSLAQIVSVMVDCNPDLTLNDLEKMVHGIARRMKSEA